MTRKRYQTDITAHVACAGDRAAVWYAILEALAFPVDCIEVQVQAGIQGGFYLGHHPLAPREQSRALDLEAFLQLAADHSPVAVSLDLAGSDLSVGTDAEYAELESLVRDAGLIGLVQLKGVEPRAFSAVRRGAPDLPYWLSLVPGMGEASLPPLCERLVQRIRHTGAIGLHTNQRFVTQLLKQTLAASDLLLSVQGAERERDMNRLLALPADNILTTRISTLLDLRSRRSVPSMRGHAFS